VRVDGVGWMCVQRRGGWMCVWGQGTLICRGKSLCRGNGAFKFGEEKEFSNRRFMIQAWINYCAWHKGDGTLFDVLALRLVCLCVCVCVCMCVCVHVLVRVCVCVCISIHTYNHTHVHTSTHTHTHTHTHGQRSPNEKRLCVSFASYDASSIFFCISFPPQSALVASWKKRSAPL